MRAPRRLAVALLLARALASCGTDDFVPAWRVQTFRVLAVVASPPDAVAGETVQLSAVLADAPAHADRAVSVAWAICAHLTVDASTGARGCAPAETIVRTGTSITFPAPAPNGTNPYGVFGFACSGGAIAFDAATATPSCRGGDGFAFIRSVRVRGAVANHNPVIARVLLDGRELAAGVPGAAPLCVGDRTQCRALPLTVEFAADAREPTAVVQPDGSVQSVPESLVTEFLVDGGDLDGSFRSDGDANLAAGSSPPHGNAFTPPSTAGAVRLWVLAHDGRGGFAAAERSVVVRPP